MFRKFFIVAIPVAIVAIACFSFGVNTASAHSPSFHGGVTSIGFHTAGCYHGSSHANACAPTSFAEIPCLTTFDDCLTAYPIYMPSYRARGF